MIKVCNLTSIIIYVFNIVKIKSALHLEGILTINKINIIGSYHTEGGVCNSDELIKIIQQISPNVVFCEVAPEIFRAMLQASETFNTPEIKALRKIIKTQSLVIIPIDLHDDPFDGRLEEMFKLFKIKIQEYFYATEIQRRETHRLGFPYLNSTECDQIHKDKESMEKNFVNKVNNYELSKLYSDWLKWNDKRENHWINVIHDYLKQNNINNAVFLVGSAHRIRLMEKIEGLQTNQEVTLNWNFNPFS